MTNPACQSPDRSAAPLAPEQLEALCRLDGCSVANAIEAFHGRLRNEGFMDSSVRCLFDRLPPTVGYAVTIKIRGSAPPTAGQPYADRTDWWDYVLSVPAPRMVVVVDVATRTGLGSFLGAVHINILRALDCVGAATNGSVRDLPAVQALGFQVFARSLSVSHAYVHIIEVGQPVEVGGLRVHSGDLLHGDLHGVQTIPLAMALEIPELAARISQRDQAVLSLCRSRDFSLDRLRATLSERVDTNFPTASYRGGDPRFP